MKDWRKLLILGAISAVFGLLVLGTPIIASVAVTVMAGTLLLIIGGLQIIGGLMGGGFWQRIVSVVLGVLLAFLGWSFLAHPLEGVVSLATVVMVMMAATGIVRLIAAWRMKQTKFFWPMLISGAASVLLAAYLFANFAVASLAILGILLGIELLFNGVGLVMLGFYLRAHPELLEKERE